MRLLVVSALAIAIPAHAQMACDDPQVIDLALQIKNEEIDALLAQPGAALLKLPPRPAMIFTKITNIREMYADRDSGVAACIGRPHVAAGESNEKPRSATW